MKLPTTVTQQHIQRIMKEATYEVFHRVADKQCIVVATLPNGFTLVGESACVDPNNYREDIGASLAKKRIATRLWELEGYLLQQRKHEEQEYADIRAELDKWGNAHAKA